MAHKLKCTVTGNWSYVSDERFMELAKHAGSQKKLMETYVSREGKRMQEAGEKVTKDYCPKNKIRCIVTGEFCFISDERMKKLIKEHGSEQAVRDQYMSRVAKHLLAEGKTKTEIRAMAADGTLPAPTGGELKPIKVQGTKKQGAKAQGKKQGKTQGKAKQGAKAQGKKQGKTQGKKQGAKSPTADHVSDTVPADATASTTSVEA